VKNNSLFLVEFFLEPSDAYKIRFKKIDKFINIVNTVLFSIATSFNDRTKISKLAPIAAVMLFCSAEYAVRQ